MIRNLGVTVLSLLLTAIVIGNAYYQKKQFYPSVVYITKSNPSMAVMYVQAFILVILVGKLMRKVFFGELRAAEFEHLMERSWYAVTETCLAFTVFRDDFSPKFVALFTLLLFLKSFHWLAEDRVDFMERSPVISFLFHLRILSLLAVLAIFDFHFVGHAYQSTLTKGASVQLVFGFEYAILLTITANICLKYVLHSIDLHSEVPWENKAVFLLYTELIMGFIKVILYILFVFIMVRIYTLPLFAIRPMYYTMRAFKRAFNDVILSRRAIRNMNTLYPDATPEELAAADNVCIICREDMRSASKKLPCNHIFHTACLRSWFQRQQTCPTCRLNILRTPNGTSGQPPPPPPPPPAPPHRQQENQQQQPPQQNVPINFSFPWRPHPQQQPEQQQNSRSDQPGGAEGGNSDGFWQPPCQQVPLPENMPFFVPPFPFIPFTIPPPMPPSSGLTDEELRRMESQSREGVEARLRCLQNIQRLLDASVLLMQQYSAAAVASQRFETLFGENREGTHHMGISVHTQTTQDLPDGAEGRDSVSQPGPSCTNGSHTESTVIEDRTQATAASSVPISEQEEARRRRLEKFS